MNGRTPATPGQASELLEQAERSRRAAALIIEELPDATVQAGVHVLDALRALAALEQGDDGDEALRQSLAEALAAASWVEHEAGAAPASGRAPSRAELERQLDRLHQMSSAIARKHGIRSLRPRLGRRTKLAAAGIATAAIATTAIGFAWRAYTAPDPLWRVAFHAGDGFEGEPELEDHISLDFHWGEADGDHGTGSEVFTVRADTCLHVSEASIVAWNLSSDGPSRLFVDGRLAVDDWGAHSERWERGRVKVAPGIHHVRVEHLRSGPGARLQLEPLPAGPGSQGTRLVYPEDTDEGQPPCGVTSPVVPDKVDSGWRAAYFGNLEFAGPASRRDDAAVDFAWRDDTPLAGIPADGFSVRWDTCLPVDEAGQFAFELRSDDGSRLFVDGETVVDNWGDHGIQTRIGDRALSKGTHHMRVEYFDSGENALVRLRARDPDGFVIPSWSFRLPLDTAPEGAPCGGSG